MICKKTVSSWLSLALLCISLPFATAQQRFSVGPRVGANLSTFNGDADGYKYRPGFTAGAFLMYSSLNHFGISVDALYSQMGAKYSNLETIFASQQQVDFRQQMAYIEVPVALRYFLTTGGKFRPNVFVGPSVAFLLKGERSPLERLGIQIPALDNTSSFRKVDLGLIAGFQLNFPGFGERQRFLIDSRYRYGLSDITIDNNARINRSTFTLTLGYGFGVGREYRSRYSQ
jgi:hypothetical protein